MTTKLMAWNDPNDRGFESDSTFQNMGQLRLNPTDPGHYTYDSDAFTRELLSHDPTNIFQEAEAVAADTEDANERKHKEDDINEQNNRDDEHDGDEEQNDNDHNEQQTNESVEEAPNPDTDIINEIDEGTQHENSEHDNSMNAETKGQEPRSATEPRYNLRSARTRNYAGRFGSNFQFFSKIPARHGVRNMIREQIQTCFTQMKAKTGIKKHGQRAVAAMLKEYVQLNDLEVMGFFKI